jgi:hypothetical protein
MLFSGLFGCFCLQALFWTMASRMWSHGVSTTPLLYSLAQQYPHISTLICTACKSSESRQDKQDCQAGPCVSDFSAAGKPSVAFSRARLMRIAASVCFDVSLNCHPKLKHTVYDSRTMQPKTCGKHVPGRPVSFSRVAVHGGLCCLGREVRSSLRVSRRSPNTATAADYHRVCQY